MRNILTLLTLGLVIFTANAQQYPYQDSSLTAMERAKDLVSRMTLEEKVSQMVNMSVAIPRLGVPSYRWWGECGHGVARSGNATIFPQNIGVAATFDDDLVRRMTDAISDEARMLFNESQKYSNEGQYTTLSFYSPSINIYRDPRWGRGQETFGEDPYLTSRMGTAYIKGLQGDDPKYLKTAACAKHFAAHSGPEEIKFGFGAEVDWEDLYETYLPAFKSAVQDGKVESVMGAYSMLNGEPGASSKLLLTDILRDDWGFTGYTTSDCGAIYKLVSNGGENKDTNGEGNFSVAKTLPEACAIALMNGLNLECGAAFLNNLPIAVKRGFLPEDMLDQRLAELMASRFRLGLFDDPREIPYNDVTPDIVNSKKHMDLAYEVAVESLVLLENKNNTLPLGKDVNYIYVTGPLSNSCDALIGNYYGASDKMTTFYEGISGRMPLGMSTQYRPGVLINSKGYNDWTVREAPEADVVVACIGLTNMFEGEGTDAIASQTKGDMVDLQIPEAQLEFVKTIRKNIDAGIRGKHDCKLVVVVASGTPLILAELKEVADAIIYAWYPGQAGGYALADVIFGNVSPSGRTPMTFVKSLEQLPEFINYEMKGRTYKYMSEEPLYPFGYGLSYAKFAYSNLQSPRRVRAGEMVEVSVEVTNTSDIAADEVVQLYVSTEGAGVGKTPLRRLADFQRVSLQPNETKVVTLEVDPTSISVLKGDMERIAESGIVKFSVGGGQPNAITDAYVEGEFEVKGKIRLEL